MRKRLMALMLMLVTIGTACSTTPSPPTTPDSNIAPAHVEDGPGGVSSVGVSLTASAVSQIVSTLSKWDPAYDANWAPRWAGVDNQNRLVLAGGVDKGKLDKLQEPARWFVDPSIDRIILWSDDSGVRPTSPTAFFSRLSRETYQKWPKAQGFLLPFDDSQWKDHVDAHAERTGVFSAFQGQAISDFLRSWFQQQLGNRLLQVDIATGYQDSPNLLKISIKVTPSSTDKQKRIEDALLLSIMPILTSSVGLVTVQYAGDVGPHVVEISRSHLLDWFNEDGDAAHLDGWFTIDGVTNETTRVYNGPSGHDMTDTELEALLAQRKQLEALLPSDSTLIIGKHRLGRHGVLAVEGTVSETWTREQEWAEYQRIVDNLFAQSPTVEYVYLILRRGKELEFMQFWSKRWVIRNYFMQKTGAKLEPLAFPLMASWYDRLSVVKP